MRGNPWYSVAAGLVTAGPVESADQLRAVARTLVLLGLETGERSVGELPRAWPVTRVVIRAAVANTVAARLCEWVGGAPAPLRLTERGRALLAGMRARRAVA